MSLFKTAYMTFIEALFPTAEAEEAVLAMGAESAFKILPRAERSPVPEACSVFSYKDERVWRLVWSIKYKKSAQGTAIASYALYQVIRVYARIVPKVVVIPMPITARRRRERGFNQCELIVDGIERLARLDTGKNTGGRLAVNTDLLVRKVHTSRQTMKDRTERLESIKDIFSVNEESARRIEMVDPSFKKEAMIVIIDDVITTGSTIKDAVETLRRAGFEKAWGLSVAH